MSRKNEKHIHKPKQSNDGKPKQNTKNISSSNKLVFYLALTIAVAVTWVTFLPSLKGGFVSWDDEGYLMDNLAVIGNFSMDGWNYIFTHFNMANYHPITLMVYNFLYNAYKFDPAPYHTFNLIFHLINTGLVFYFITKLSRSRYLVAFVVALLFGIHPLHVESVAWISEAKDVLYTFFFLLSLLAYVKYNNQKENLKYYVFSLLLFVLACLSKGMAVSMSVILILIDYLNNKKITKQLILEKIPFFILSIFFGVLAIKAQQAADGLFDLSMYGMGQKMLFPFYAVFFYIYKMVLPFNLAILYPYPTTLTFEYILAPIILFAISIAAYLTKSKTPKVIFGLLFFGACVAPIIQILPVGASIASDRYFYVASIGLFFIIGEGIDYLYNTRFKSNNSVKTGIAISGAVICLFLMSISIQRIKVWENTYTLWTDLSQTNPTIDKAWYGLGLFMQREGEKASADFERQNLYNQAKKLYLIALDKNPKNLKALNNLGNCYYNSKPTQVDSAFNYYSRLLKLDTTYVNVYHNLGNIYISRNQLDKAIQSYNKAISLDKNFSISYYGLGVIYEALKDEQRANENFVKAAKLGYVDAQKIVEAKKLKY